MTGEVNRSGVVLKPKWQNVRVWATESDTVHTHPPITISFCCSIRRSSFCINWCTKIEREVFFPVLSSGIRFDVRAVFLNWILRVRWEKENHCVYQTDRRKVNATYVPVPSGATARRTRLLRVLFLLLWFRCKRNFNSDEKEYVIFCFFVHPRKWFKEKKTKVATGSLFGTKAVAWVMQQGSKNANKKTQRS